MPVPWCVGPGPEPSGGQGWSEVAVVSGGLKVVVLLVGEAVLLPS